MRPEYLQKRKFSDALMQFRAAAESDKDSAKAHWGLARAYENLGQFNETLDELRKAVELDDTNLEAKAKLGNYFLLLQRKDPRRDTYRGRKVYRRPHSRCVDPRSSGQARYCRYRCDQQGDSTRSQTR